MPLTTFPLKLILLMMMEMHEYNNFNFIWKIITEGRNPLISDKEMKEK